MHKLAAYKLQSWTKRLGHIVIYIWFEHSPITPLPPWAVLDVTGQNWTSTLLRGGGGNRGMRVLKTVYWRSLANFLAKKGGNTRSVPGPFGQDCTPDFRKPEKNTSKAIIAQPYQWRCCSWRSSSEARIASWDSSTPLRLEQGQVSELIFENDAIRNGISNNFDKWCISQPKAQ